MDSGASSQRPAGRSNIPESAPTPRNRLVERRGIQLFMAFVAHPLVDLPLLETISVAFDGLNRH